jgi:methyl halide transferase
MKTAERFINHYKKGYMPWAHQLPDFNLVDMVNHWPIKPCKTLEPGCGTGTDSIWLSKNGFDVTALDVSPIAIELAKENAENAGADCHFRKFDFLTGSMKDTFFDFVFDRGYFHSYDSAANRKKVAGKVAKYLNSGGLWLTLVGSCDSAPRDTGPPMRSAKEIIGAVEPYFELQILKKSTFGSESEKPANIWVCLLKKRKVVS